MRVRVSLDPRETRDTRAQMDQETHGFLAHVASQGISSYARIRIVSSIMETCVAIKSTSSSRRSRSKTRLNSGIFEDDGAAWENVDTHLQLCIGLSNRVVLFVALRGTLFFIKCIKCIY